jgi:aminoglycoside phosphotransferase family enzyme
MSSQLPDFINFYLHPSHFDHPADQVNIVQTHISYVLLAGNFVYKFKKPVDFGFLDFTTLEKRKQYCQQELILNQRLCPDIYLDVITITRIGDGFEINGSGEVVEYGVKMRRMPEERMMGGLLQNGEVDQDMIRRIVETLVPFYEKAESGTEIQQFGTAASVSVNVLENFDQTKDFVGQGALTKEQYELISHYAKSFLEQESLFLKRSKTHVKDCHGDLYSANICLADSVYIFDCIEFNERFRYCDVASDVAFLAMDLDFHGQEGLSSFFIQSFVSASNDPGLLDVLNFYKCYRAYVRGKIGLFTAHSPEVDETTRKNSLEQAAKYFQLAEKYAV